MEFPGQHFDCDIASEHAVARLVHLAHATDSQQAEDAIRAKLAAQQRWTIALNQYATEQLQSWPLAKVYDPRRVWQQRLDFLPKRLVVRARLTQERHTLVWCPIERRFKQTIDGSPTLFHWNVAHRRIGRSSLTHGPLGEATRGLLPTRG